MKTLKDNNKNYTLITAAFVFIALQLTYHAIPWITWPLYTLWLLPLILVFFIVTPLGNIQLKSKQPYKKLSTLRKTTYTMLIQVALLLAYAGFCNIIGNIVPAQFHMQNELFSQTIPIIMLHFGLAPWCMLTILAISFTYACYVKNKNTYYSQLCSPLIKNCNPGSPTGNLINTYIQMTNVTAIAFLIMTLAVLITHWIIAGTMPMIHGFNLATVLFTITIMILSKNKQVKKLIIHASLYVLPSLMCFIITMVIAIILTIFCVFLYPLATTTLPIYHFLITTTPPQWHTLWVFISLAWWFFMVPLLAPIFARYHGGYSVRNIILTMMGLPFFGFILAMFNNAHIINLHPLGEFIQHSRLGTTLSTVAVASLIIISFNARNTSSSVMASMSSPKKAKYRSPSLALRAVGFYSSFFLGLYLCLGIHFLSLCCLCPAYIINILVLCIAAMLIRTLWLHYKTAKK